MQNIKKHFMIFSTEFKPVDKLSQAPTQGAFLLLYWNSQTNSSFMTASAATPKARKTRTRKPRAAAVKTVTKAAVKKTVVKTTSPRRPSTAKLISFSRYVQDAKQRWAIHEFEINALASDLVKGFNIVQPQVQRLANQFKNWHTRTPRGAFFLYY